MPLSRAVSRPIPREDTRQRLAALAESASPERFVALLVEEADPLVRERALTHMVRLDGAFPARALALLIGADDTELRNAAIETLGALGNRAIDALAPLLADVRVDLRIYALTALAQVESPSAAALALHVALNDPDVNVCCAALDVIASGGGRNEAARLDEVVARFPDCPYLAFAAQTSKARIG